MCVYPLHLGLKEKEKENHHFGGPPLFVTHVYIYIYANDYTDYAHNIIMTYVGLKVPRNPFLIV